MNLYHRCLRHLLQKLVFTLIPLCPITISCRFHSRFTLPYLRHTCITSLDLPCHTYVIPASIPSPKELINYPVKLLLTRFEPYPFLWRVDNHTVVFVYKKTKKASSKIKLVDGHKLAFYWNINLIDEPTKLFFSLCRAQLKKNSEKHAIFSPNKPFKFLFDQLTSLDLLTFDLLVDMLSHRVSRVPSCPLSDLTMPISEGTYNIIWISFWPIY